MRTRLTYGFLRGALLVVALGLTACVNTLELATPVGNGGQGIDQRQIVADAQAYFNAHGTQLSRSAEATPTEEAPFVVGNLVPDWDSAVTIANEEKVHTDFAMRKDYDFYWLPDGDVERSVKLYSRFASVEEFALDTMSQYVATYIPDEEYLRSYPAVAQDYGINCAELYEFSGVVLYTMLSGHYVAAGRYQDGELTQRAFLYDENKTTEENIADFYAIMEGYVLGIAVAQQDTRVVFDNENNPIEIEEIVITQKKPFQFAPIEIMSDSSGVVHPIVDNHFPIIIVGGGGSGSTTTEEEEEEPTSEELVEALFNTEGLSDEHKDEVGKMLQEIIKDCMGEELYNQLVEMGETNITISFDPNRGKPSSYNRDSHSIVLTNFHSDVLLHEIFHTFQHHQVELNNPNSNKFNSYSKASANYEVEAQIARYVYLLRRRAYVDNDNYDNYIKTSLGKNIRMAGDCLSVIGFPYVDSEMYNAVYFKSAIDKVLEIASKNSIIINYNEQFSASDNLSNIRKASIKCN